MNNASLLFVIVASATVLLQIATAQLPEDGFRKLPSKRPLPAI